MAKKDYSETKEFQEGYAAYIYGKPEDSNPYPSANGSSSERKLWYDGYFTAQIRDNLKNLIGSGRLEF